MAGEHQFRNESEREVYEKFKDRSFYDEAMPLKQRLALIDMLLLRAVEEVDSVPLALETEHVFAICDLLRDSWQFIDDVASASLLECHWISDINKQAGQSAHEEVQP